MDRRKFMQRMGLAALALPLLRVQAKTGEPPPVKIKARFDYAGPPKDYSIALHPRAVDDLFPSQAADLGKAAGEKVDALTVSHLLDAQRILSNG